MQKRSKLSTPLSKPTPKGYKDLSLRNIDESMISKIEADAAYLGIGVDEHLSNILLYSLYVQALPTRLEAFYPATKALLKMGPTVTFLHWLRVLEPAGLKLETILVPLENLKCK